MFEDWLTNEVASFLEYAKSRGLSRAQIALVCGSVIGDESTSAARDLTLRQIVRVAIEASQGEWQARQIIH